MLSMDFKDSWTFILIHNNLITRCTDLRPFVVQLQCERVHAASLSRSVGLQGVSPGKGSIRFSIDSAENFPLDATVLIDKTGGFRGRTEENWIGAFLKMKITEFICC